MCSTEEPKVTVPFPFTDEAAVMVSEAKASGKSEGRNMVTLLKRRWSPYQPELYRSSRPSRITEYLRSPVKCPLNNPLRLSLDRLKMLRVPEALRVQLIDVLRPRRPRREPAPVGRHLHPSDRIGSSR